jgi:O-antigen/teichoic acid export membrane protein
LTERYVRVRALWAPIGRLERHARVLAALKLANVGLAMLWGFAVTFVFVRLLPIGEFRTFLLLVAFANFTVSADFGFSGIIYARLRRFRLAEAAGDFRPQDVAMLFAFMAAVVMLGAVVIGAGLATGHIATGRPGLFMAFYLLTATNIFGILAKRALAALDHNLLWEVIDAVRRGLSILLLILALAGLPILASVCLQIGLAVAALLVGLMVVHVSTGLRRRDWLLRGAGFGAVWRDYMRDMGTTMLLTLSDVAAYNAPYFGIALVTHDPRPLLVFDFVFKISRALTAMIRALVEAVLPRLTEAYHAGRTDRARALIGRLRILGLGSAAALGLFLLVAGRMLSGVLFDGKAVLSEVELAMLALLLLGLAMLCVSTYVHNGFGRFGALLPPSFAFLLLSVLSVLGGAWIAGAYGLSFALAFLILYAGTHVLLGFVHEHMLCRITRP